MQTKRQWLDATDGISAHETLREFVVRVNLGLPYPLTSMQAQRNRAKIRKAMANARVHKATVRVQ